MNEYYVKYVLSNISWTELARLMLLEAYKFYFMIG